MPKGVKRKHDHRELLIGDSPDTGEKSVPSLPYPSIEDCPVLTSTPVTKILKCYKQPDTVTSSSALLKKSIGIHIKRVDNIVCGSTNIMKTQSEENLDRLCETLSLVRSPQKFNEKESPTHRSDVSGSSRASKSLNRSKETVAESLSVIASIKNEVTDASMSDHFDTSKILTTPNPRKRKHSQVYSDVKIVSTSDNSHLQHTKNLAQKSSMGERIPVVPHTQDVSLSLPSHVEMLPNLIDDKCTISLEKLSGRKRRGKKSVTPANQKVFKKENRSRKTTCPKIDSFISEQSCSDVEDNTNSFRRKGSRVKHITVKMNFSPDRKKSDKKFSVLKKRDSLLKVSFGMENKESSVCLQDSDKVQMKRKKLSSAHGTSSNSRYMVHVRKSTRTRKPNKHLCDTNVNDGSGDNTMQSESETVPTSRKTRGKRKSLDVPESRDSDEEHSSGNVKTNSTKKTNRKKIRRKKALEESEDEKEIKEEEVEQRTCLRCSKVFSDMAGLKSHMMFIHSAMWRKSCPEGSTEHEALMTVIKKTGKLACPKCGKELHFLHYYYNHLKWCGREEEMFLCEVCQRSVKLRWEKMHYRSHEIREMELEVKREKNLECINEAIDNPNAEFNVRGSTKRSAAKRAEHLLHDISIHGELANQKGESHDPDETVHLGFESESDDSDIEAIVHMPGVMRRRDRFRDEKMITSSGQRYLNCFKATINLMAKQFSTDVYPQYQAQRSHWKTLDPSDYKAYLPSHSQSPDFLVKSSEECSVERLKLFQAKRYENGTFCMNVGGPVWGLGWCPVPVFKKTDQYVAVTCNSDMDKTHPMYGNFSGPGLIQIWNLGSLSTEMKPSPGPKFSLGIAHDYGCVRDVKWCPSGCWQSRDIHRKTEDSLPRLGLTAIACTDGTVRIYSIPYPESLSEDTAKAFYKAVPAISLVPHGHKQYKEKTGSACCVAWQIGNKHRYLSVGYSNGAVRLWDLCTSSPLLQVQSSIELKPFKSFYAHQRCVLRTAWSPHLPNHFATGGPDRYSKVWSVENTRVPQFVEKLSSITSIVWPLNSCALLLATDHCFGLVGNQVKYLDAILQPRKNSLFKLSLTNHNACVWDLAFSDWLRICVTCDNNGVLAGAMVQDFSVYSADPKNKKKEFVISMSHLKHKSNLQKDNNSSDMDGKKSSETGYAEKPKQSETSLSKHDEFRANEKSTNSTANTCKNDMTSKSSSAILEVTSDKVTDSGQPNKEQGLEETEDKKHNCDNLADALEQFYIQYDDPSLTFDRKMKELDPYHFPLTALYRVCFSANLQSCNWVACGGQAGIVRVMSIFDIFSDNWKTFINQNIRDNVSR